MNTTASPGSEPVSLPHPHPRRRGLEPAYSLNQIALLRLVGGIKRHWAEFEKYRVTQATWASLVNRRAIVGLDGAHKRGIRVYYFLTGKGLADLCRLCVRRARHG